MIAPAVEEVPLNGLPFELPETSGPLPSPIDTVAVLPPEPTLALPILVPPPIVAVAFVPPFAPLLPVAVAVLPPPRVRLRFVPAGPPVTPALSEPLPPFTLTSAAAA